jgi:hypothetical protein
MSLNQTNRTKPLCVKGWCFVVFWPRASGPVTCAELRRSVAAGLGSDLSEVPVFRDLPAALDFRVAPDCPPGPLSS